MYLTIALIWVFGVLISLFIAENAQNKYLRLHKKAHPDKVNSKRSIWPKEIQYSGNKPELEKIVFVNNMAYKTFRLLMWSSFILIVFLFRDRGR